MSDEEELYEEEPAPRRKKRKGGRKKKKRGDGDFDFKSPEEMGVTGSDEPSSLFTITQDKGKKGESCPVCGSRMNYKKRVDSWYCPQCKTFY